MVTVDCSLVGRRLAAFLVVCVFAAGVSGCTDTTGVPTSSDPLGVRTSNVQVLLLSDAPSDMIANAEVWISHVYLQGGGEDDLGRVDLFKDLVAPLHFDLLNLQEGIAADLTGLVEVEVGLYQGLRLVVDRAQVTLLDGLEFSDGTDTATLMVPSGSASGIKVMLNGAIDAAEGESTTLTVDFDVNRNFVIQSGQGEADIERILFTPVLLELGRDGS